MKHPVFDFVSPLVISSAFLKAVPVLQALSLKLTWWSWQGAFFSNYASVYVVA